MVLSELAENLEIDVTWQNVVEVVEEMLSQTKKGEVNLYKKLQESLP
jgi:hypothetical protein